MKKILIFLLLSFNFSLSVSSEIVFFDLSSPRSTFKTFLKNMKAYKAGENSYLGKTLECFDLDNIGSDAKEITGANAARDLINTIDRLEFVFLINFDIL